MENIQNSKEIAQKIVSLFKERQNIWIIFFIIGITGFIPLGISFFGSSSTAFYGSPTFIFFILGIIYWSQSMNSIKKINNNEYQVFKAKCQKVGALGYASVDNNEILSKKQNKPLKAIEILGSAKNIKVNDEIGIIQIDKEFWVFPLSA